MFKSKVPFSNSVLYVAVPMSISWNWNFGAGLGLVLVSQIVSGVVLSLQYVNMSSESFSSLISLCLEGEELSILRFLHMNGASIFFLLIYWHMGRGIYFMSFKEKHLWFSGVTLYLMLMMIAFLGYVLPWGQMSFWGATVITGMLTSIPLIGDMVAVWVWGGFSVGGSTLTRFYSLHIIMPFILSAIVCFHILLLHKKGSSSPFLFNMEKEMSLSPLLMMKDVVAWSVIILMLILVMSLYPYEMGDVENFKEADPLLTPFHIKPEWYFLYAYSILRSVPNKLGGVIALLMSVMVLYTLPFMKFSKNNGYFYYLKFWMWSVIVGLLTFTGGQTVAYPYDVLSKILFFLYFEFYIYLFMKKN